MRQAKLYEYLCNLLKNMEKTEASRGKLFI